MKIIFFLSSFYFVLENYFFDVASAKKKILAHIIKLEIRVSQNLVDGTSINEFFLLRREAYAQQIQINAEVFVTRYILMDVLNVLVYTESICG